MEIATSLEPKLTWREGEGKPCSGPRSQAPHASALDLLTVTPVGQPPLTTTLWVACTCYAVNILKHGSDFFPCVFMCVWNFSLLCSVFKVVAGTPSLATPNSFIFQTFDRFLQGIKDCAQNSFLAVFDGRHQVSLDKVLKWIVS